MSEDFGIRTNAEYCLIATKGIIERQDKSISQIIYWQKENHSKKPDIVRDNIIQLVGDLPRIELFAREKHDGWTVWGCGVEKEYPEKSKTVQVKELKHYQKVK